jgi:allantoicase
MHSSLVADGIDGGTKRVRVFGYPYAPSSTPAALPTTLTIPALPLTTEAFKPYGQVIQAYSFPSSAPKRTDVSIANQGTAAKFHRLAHVTETYPEGMLTRGGLHISTIRAFGPQHETKNGVTIDVTVLER